MAHTQENKTKQNKSMETIPEEAQTGFIRQRLKTSCYKHVQGTKGNKLTELKESVRIMCPPKENINKNTEVVRKSQREVLELIFCV